MSKYPLSLANGRAGSWRGNSEPFPRAAGISPTMRSSNSGGALVPADIAPLAPALIAGPKALLRALLDDLADEAMEPCKLGTEELWCFLTNSFTPSWAPT